MEVVMTSVEAVEAWVEKWRNLKAWGRPLEEAKICVQKDNDRGLRGWAYPCMRSLVVKAGPDIPRALNTLLHEYAHLAAPATEHHGPKWRRAYSAAVAEVSGIAFEGEHLTYQDARAMGARYMRAWFRTSGLATMWALAQGS